MRPPFTDPDTRVVYTFDHLNPIDATVSVTIGGQRYLVPIVVLFSNHCFTDGKNNTVTMNDSLYILTDDTGHRAFCDPRYQRSLTLPTRLLQVIANSDPCFRLSKEGSYIHIHDILTRNRFTGWYVYFKFDNPKAGAAEAIRVSVTSYHYRQTHPDNLRWKGSVKFPVLVTDWLRVRPDNLARCQLVTDTAEDVRIEDSENEKPA